MLDACSKCCTVPHNVNDLVESGSITCHTPDRTSSPLHTVTPTITGTKKIKEEQKHHHRSMTVSVTCNNHHQNTITTTTSVTTATTTVKSAMISLAMRRPSSPGNSSGSDNDTINNSSAATALRRLYFKSGRSTKTKTQQNSPSVAVTQISTVPKVIIMGTSTTSATDINTSTESASTLLTNVTATDTSEINDSLDMGDTSGQSEPLLSSLDEPNQTSTSIGSDQEITELELTSVYSKADVSILDNLEQESSLTIQKQPTSGIPRTAPSISTSSIHFPFDPPQSPRSVKTIQKNETLFTFQEAATFLEQHKLKENKQENRQQQQQKYSQKHSQQQSQLVKEQFQLEDRNNSNNSTMTTSEIIDKNTKYNNRKYSTQRYFDEKQQLHHDENHHHQQQHYQQHFEQLQINQQQHQQQQQQRKLSTSSCYSYKKNDDRRPSTKSVSSLWNWNFENDKENKKRKESCCSAKYSSSTSTSSSNERPTILDDHEIICEKNNFINGLDDVKKQRKDNNKLQTKNNSSSNNKYSEKLIKTSPKHQQEKYRYSSKINSAPAVTTQPNRKDKFYANDGGGVVGAVNCIADYITTNTAKNYDQKDLTMFPFDKEALDYQRIQRECFTVNDAFNDEYDNETKNSKKKYYYNFEENSSDTESSSDSDKSICKGTKLFHHTSPSKLDKHKNKTDIFQQYTLLSQQEATNQNQQQQQHQQQQQQQDKKRQYTKQRNRPDYINHKTKYDRTTTGTPAIITTNSLTAPKNVDAAFSPAKTQNSNYIDNNNISTSPRSIKDLNNFEDISNKFDKIAAKHTYNTTTSGSIQTDNEIRYNQINSPISHQAAAPLEIDSNFHGSNISLSSSSNNHSSSYHTNHYHPHSHHHHQQQQQQQQHQNQNQQYQSTSLITNSTNEINNSPQTNCNMSMANSMTGTTGTTILTRGGGGGGGGSGTPSLPDFRVDIFLEPLNLNKYQQKNKENQNYQHQQQQQESSLSSSICHNVLTNSNKQQQQHNKKQQQHHQQELHDHLDECQKTSQNTGPINVTPNPMEVAVCTQPRATIVVQQPSLSLDNTVETMLLKDEGEFEGVEKSRKSKLHQRDESSNMRQLLDVTNTFTFEELRDFEMRYGSPHHCRSQSVKTPRTSGRPNQLTLPQQRSRVASMPNTGVEEEYYRLRHFSITGKGIVNRGDSLKSRRSRSNNSVRSNNSSNSSTEHLTATAQIVPPAGGSARTSATCSLASSRESSTSNPGSGPFRVLMLGGPAVGKTSLISQFMTSEYLHAYDTSIDDESGEKSVNVLLNGEESELVFIDHPSTEVSPENCLSSYNPHGYCIIYSSADRGSFNVAEMILQSLWTTENIAQKAVILVGNKADLARSRTVTSDEGKSMATAYDCKFIETSVGINHNVDELLVGLLSQIRLKLENPEKSRDLFRKRSSRRNKRACSPLGVPCLSGGNNPSNPGSPINPNPNLPEGTPPRSVQSSPRKYRGSRTSASLKVKGLLGRVWARDSKSKSCENLHVL